MCRSTINCLTKYKNIVWLYIVCAGPQSIVGKVYHINNKKTYVQARCVSSHKKTYFSPMAVFQ